MTEYEFLEFFDYAALYRTPMYKGLLSEEQSGVTNRSRALRRIDILTLTNQLHGKTIIM